MSENIFKKWTFLQLLTCKNDPIQSQNLIPSFLVRGLPFRTTWFKLLHRHRIRIRHKIQCWCPRGKSSSSDQFPSPYPWITKSPKKFKDFAFCKQSITYDHVKSITSVTANTHEDTVKNGLLTDVRYYFLIHVSKQAILHCNPVLLSSRKVLVLEVQFTSPCPCVKRNRVEPCPRTLSRWQHHW